MPGKLKTEPRLARPDDVYNAIVEAHQGLGEEQSRRLSAKLILMLANHIGDDAVVEEAVRLALANMAVNQDSK